MRALIHSVSTLPHLAADTEGLEWVEAEPAGVSCLSEAVHELGVERPLQRGQTDQDHMLFLRGQLVLQDIVASPGGGKRSQLIFVCKSLVF